MKEFLEELFNEIDNLSERSFLVGQFMCLEDSEGARKNSEKAKQHREQIEKLVIEYINKINMKEV